jgi:hypothetical protein
MFKTTKVQVVSRIFNLNIYFTVIDHHSPDPSDSSPETVRIFQLSKLIDKKSNVLEGKATCRLHRRLQNK